MYTIIIKQGKVNKKEKISEQSVKKTKTWLSMERLSRNVMCNEIKEDEKMCIYIGHNMRNIKR